MALELGDLLAKNDYRSIALELIAFERERDAVDVDALAVSPEDALHGHPEVELEYTLSPAHGCSVYGVYRYRPGRKAVILVHPSLTEARDNFTILHEYGHHVQRHHSAWVSTTFRLPERRRRYIEELVADAFAAEALLPADTAVAFHLTSAAAIRDYHATSRGSRAAVAMRAATLFATAEEFVAAVFDLDGRPVFARSTSDKLFAPARGLIQPGLAALIARAAAADSGSLSGPIPGGLITQAGQSRNDLLADIALDYVAPYAFVTIRTEHRFGYAPNWTDVTSVCSNLSCATEFLTSRSLGTCDTCRQQKCPECSRCECERERSHCPDCTLEYSAYESADLSRHECPW